MRGWSHEAPCADGRGRPPVRVQAKSGIKEESARCTKSPAMQGFCLFVLLSCHAFALSSSISISLRYQEGTESAEYHRPRIQHSFVGTGMEWLTLNDFLQICEQAQDKEPPGEIEAEEGQWNSSKALYERIRLCLGRLSLDVRQNAQFLIKELIVRNIATGLVTHPSLPILMTISDAARAEDASEPVANYWQAIVDDIYSCRRSLHFFAEGYSTDTLYQQQHDLGHACKALEAYGIYVDFTEGKVLIHEEDHPRLESIISSLCSRIGGVDLLGQCFQVLAGRYDRGMARFLVFREVSSWQSTTRPEYPWGYLVALGIKFSGCRVQWSKETLEERRDLIVELAELLKNIFIVFEVQPYSPWEGLFIDGRNFFEYMQDGVVYDNLISFSQICDSHAEELLDFPLREFLTDSLASANAEIRDLVQVARAILRLALPSQIRLVRLHEVIKQSRLPRHKVEALIDSFLAYQVGMANRELAFPPFSTEIDGNFKPIFRVSDNMLLILPAPLTGLAAVNCTYNAVSFVDGRFNNTRDSLLGDRFEDWVRDCLSRSGITWASGDFYSTEGRADGECDVVIETDKTIYFIEIKKKALTRSAMAGDEFMLLKDLARSLMFSQTQAMKAEYQIRKNGSIRLTAKGGENHDISLNNRDIERISLSLLDFGSFQDRISIQQIMDNIYRHAFTTIDGARAGDLDDFNRIADEMREEANLLFSLEDISGSAPLFRNSVFMSAPQLLTILANVASNNDFDREVKMTKWLTTSSRDFYREYSAARSIKADK